MAIDPTSSVSGSTAADNAASRIPIQTLGQDDFLKLLVTQMSSQDPLNPQTDTEFIAQMAQFSALEQNKSMQSDMAQLQASSLIGKTVSVQDSNNQTITGAVSSVQIEAGTPKLVVNGQQYDLNQVQTIAPDTSNNTTSSLQNYARISQLGR